MQPLGLYPGSADKECPNPAGVEQMTQSFTQLSSSLSLPIGDLIGMVAFSSKHANVFAEIDASVPETGDAAATSEPM